MRRREFVAAGSIAALAGSLGAFRYQRRRAAELPAESALLRDPAGILDLAPGFRYRVVQREGERMSDGYRVPGRPDAMACFPLAGGAFALMRNHELDTSTPTRGPYFPESTVPEEAYDARSMGGVTRVVMDAAGKVLSSNLVLAGTARNCAAGPSPWGYLSCEESVERGHGHVFLCAVAAASVQQPRKIANYGRFLHEAVAIDPETGAAYLTEDRNDGCLYRFVPRDKSTPFGDGVFQALAIAGKPRFHLGDSAPRHGALAITWLDVPLSAGDDDQLRYAAQERGAAIVRRGEGIWRMDGGFAFTSTSGGHAQLGQIFELTPSGAGGQLRLLYESEDRDVLDMPDNITFSPWGDLLVCEDNQRSAYLRIVTRAGDVLPFAHNSGSSGELAGVCFSPSGKQLFVNLQEEGLTLLIEGPFRTPATA